MHKCPTANQQTEREAPPTPPKNKNIFFRFISFDYTTTQIDWKSIIFERLLFSWFIVERESNLGLFSSPWTACSTSNSVTCIFYFRVAGMNQNPEPPQKRQEERKKNWEMVDIFSVLDTFWLVALIYRIEYTRGNMCDIPAAHTHMSYIVTCTSIYRVRPCACVPSPKLKKTPELWYRKRIKSNKEPTTSDGMEHFAAPINSPLRDLNFSSVVKTNAQHIPPSDETASV